MLDVSRVRTRIPQFRGQSDHYEPAPEPSAPPSSPPRTRRHVRRLVHRWHKLFNKIYKTYEQRRLLAILSEHVQEYEDLGWQRWSGESRNSKVVLVLKVISEVRKLVVAVTQACDRVRNAASLFEKFTTTSSGLWKFRSFFGYTAAGAWVYRGVIVAYYTSEESEFVEETLRAPAEAPRPLLLE